MRMLVATLPLLAVASAGCPPSSIDLEGRACPCVEGYVCDPCDNRCHRSTGDLGDAGDGTCTVKFGANTGNAGPAQADTTLNEASAGDNNGGTDHIFPDGMPMQVGLLRFDLGSQIPPGSTVVSATLHLWNHDNVSPDSFGVFQVLEAWDEGTFDASPGISNWNQRQAPSTNWTTPGCGVGSRASTPSGGFTPTGGPCGYPCLLTIEWVVSLDATLVQRWVTNPASNFGIAIVDLSGTDGFTFRSRESRVDGERPSLVVTYR